jgi:GNAT superfamily N-acetyltransferase
VIHVAESRDLAHLEKIENEADALLVEYLHAAAWSAAPGIEERMSRVGYVLALAENENEDAVGFVHVLLMADRAHLEQLSVLPSHVRRGYGRSLVEAAKVEAAALGCDSITLRTFAEVPWNAPFYADCGFVEAAPQTPFELELVRVEDILGLSRVGRRVQMACRLL